MVVSKIGERIRRLRKEKDVTQEDLAKYFNISFQAVSKWENGTAYPDITLIPALANFFAVTTDELFGMREQEQNERIEAIFKEYQRNSSKGLLEENEKLLRNGLNEFPNSFRVTSLLSHTLFGKFCAGGDISLLDEVIEKANLILTDCTDDELRYSAMQVLAYSYDAKGNKEMAKQIANRLPVHINRQQILVSVLEREEKTMQIQTNMLKDLDSIGGSLDLLSRACERDNQFENALYYLSVKKRLLHVMFEEKDFLFFHCRFVGLFLQMAEVEVHLGDRGKAIADLENAMKHAIAYDKLPTKAKYTSRCFDRLEYDKNAVSGNYSGTQTELLLDKLENKRFDQTRDDECFKEIVSRLQACTGSKS